ncbi:uncharacterized protein A1O9_03412 [Exophiala aquamarina CBS 119918]|uniref:Thioredoxin domain-containing protein n=1 Tax=Exophiala aquamarina CBS 119918 TaxID=1182545 RepID=A0A072PPP7_9EURO|nr:uncharacterized protein A1O9_03412 [Exophiala aquamarina CBS 119918]KEF61841.1 hypothetical protein A1O9_03412 [Exophiala aquamarina CBS 119918]
MSEEQSKSEVYGDPTEATHQEEDDADALLASLEEEDDSCYRSRRLQELRSASEAAKAPRTLTATSKAFITLKSDDEALSFTTQHERAVVHFFHPEFARCSAMDVHCEKIAETHAQQQEADVSFARIDVKNAPFVVEKLGVRILPCVIGFVKGVVKGKVTGFEGLCWDGKEESFAVTRALEDTLINWTVLKKRYILGHLDDDDSDHDNAREAFHEGRRGIRDRKKTAANDDDDEWD